MHRHPDLGYNDEGRDLAAPALYEACGLPFGRAQVLPPVAFRSKVFGDLEDEKIWTRAWVAVGAATQIAGVGDMLPFTVGNHGVHVQRTADGFVGRFNKAQHGGCRFVPLQCQQGVKTKCSYTSCGYSRDRDAIVADELAEGLPATRHYLGDQPERLLPVGVEAWGPLLFVNLDQRRSALAEQLEGVAQQLAEDIAQPWQDVGGFWSEHRCNWKLAGSALIDHVVPPGAMERVPLTAAQVSADDGALSVRVPLAQSESLSGAIAPRRQDALLCWLFPNLILLSMTDHLVSVVLQPTGYASCLTRVRLFRTASVAADVTNRRSQDAHLEHWRAAIDQACAAAVQRQEVLQKWATPLLPDTAFEDMPVEESCTAYRFQRYFVDRLLVQHAYVWNAPLYSAAVR